MRKEERWERRENLGTGTFGTVWLEKLITDNDEEKYRATKEIKRACRGLGLLIMYIAHPALRNITSDMRRA
jgi:hypothetical protein